MPDSQLTMITEDLMCFDLLPVSWATSLSPPSSIQCISACSATPRRGVSTSQRCTNRSTRTMQSGYPCLLTTTSHQKISYIKKFLNGMERRWRKWAGTCLKSYPSLSEAEAPLIVRYSIAQYSAHMHCWNSIFMHDINLTMMQHWATLRMPCIVFTPSKMFSYLCEPAKRRRPKPMPWEQTSWWSER